MADVYLAIAFSFVFIVGLVIGAVFERLNEIAWHKDRRKGFVRIPLSTGEPVPGGIRPGPDTGHTYSNIPRR